MDKEGHAYYVVRKGNIVAVYKSLDDCQIQISPSVSGPPVSVYKGYFMCNETQEYLSAHCLKNASFAIDKADLNDDQFGTLVPCSFQEVMSSTAVLKEDSRISPKSSLGMDVMPHQVSSNHTMCYLEFDGASKGNPGKAGAGAIIRSRDGHVMFRVREGLGVVTNNVSEYRSLILGMKYAISKGFNQIYVSGDSQLVCMQVNGIWQTKQKDMIELCKEVNVLKKMFLAFQINHVRREFNAEADAQANLAINLPANQIFEERGEAC